MPDWPTVPAEPTPDGLARQARRSFRSIRSSLFRRNDSAGSLGGLTYSKPSYDPFSGFFFLGRR